MNSRFIVAVFLISFTNVAASSLQEVLDEKIAIRQTGQALHVERNNVLTNDPDLRTLRADYDTDLLRLVLRILENNERLNACVALSPEEKMHDTRKDLGNIALTCGLMTDRGIKNKYNNRDPDGYNLGNFWDDFAYLTNFNLQPADPRHIQIGEFSDEWVRAIMQGLAITLLKDTCTREISPDATLDTHRNIYRDHRRFAPLYEFVAYKREKHKVQRALDKISHVRDLHFTLDPQNIHRSVLLNVLIAVGETCTPQNLTPPTKALCQHISADDWKMFISLRNRLAHVEWDIPTRALDTYFTTHDGSELIPSLQYIESIFQLMRARLNSFPNATAMSAHYREEAPVVPIAVIEPPVDFNPLVTLVGALPKLSNAEEKRGRTNHADAFSRVSMVQRIRDEEIPMLRKIFNLPGEEALDDEFPEDVDAIQGDGVSTVLGVIKALNQSSPELGPTHPELEESMRRIKHYYEMKGTQLRLVLPKDLFAQLSQRIGVGGAMELHLTADLLTKIAPQFETYVKAVNIYGRHCLLGKSFIQHPERVDAAFHHFGRIGKFLAEIPVEAVEGTMTPAEFRAFRNLAQHGSEEVDSSSLENYDFLMRYTHILIHTLMPAFERAGFEVIPILLPTH